MCFPASCRWQATSTAPAHLCRQEPETWFHRSHQACRVQVAGRLLLPGAAMMEMTGSAAHALLGNVQDDHSLILGAASLEAPVAFAIPGPASMVTCHLTPASGSAELRTFGPRGNPVRHMTAALQSIADTGERHPSAELACSFLAYDPQESSHQ